MNKKNSIGILAYGSLISNPGLELEDKIERRINNVETPFEVEYARKSSTRNGAPTLVPVPNGRGGKVQAQIFVLKANIDKQEACNMLYRREINKVKSDKIYDDEKQRNMDDSVVINLTERMEECSKVFYTSLNTNFEEILDDKLSLKEKAALLANAAIGSIEKNTYSRGRDGIRYLKDAIVNGIQTPLTEDYRKAVLESVDGAEDLESARQITAKQKGIIT